MLDYELLVIGAGSGGLAAAIRAASYGVRVAIAEAAQTGGACVNYGCIPEKLLDFAAGFNRMEAVATSYGWQECARVFNWSHFVAAESQHIQHLNQVHFNHLQDAGVTLLHGHASFIDAHTVRVGDRPVTADTILIAVGALAQKPTIPGVEHSITWHELYHLSQQPKSLAVLGDDPIGVKITGSLNALGSEVTLITPGDTILPQLDPELSQEIQQRLVQQGVQIIHNAKATEIKLLTNQLSLQTSNNTAPLIVDTVLMDAPRHPQLAGLQVDRVCIQLTSTGAIHVDAWSRTTQPHIFAIGDCTQRMPLTPSAIAQGRAFADTEFGKHPHQAQLTWVPMSLSSHPEAASVGLSEPQARARFGDAVRCYRTTFRPLIYCLADWNVKTFMKVVVNSADDDRILGLHIVGDGAVEMLQGFAIALKLGATKRDLDTAVGIHPSSAEELFSL